MLPTLSEIFFIPIPPRINLINPVSYPHHLPLPSIYYHPPNLSEEDTGDLNQIFSFSLKGSIEMGSNPPSEETIFRSKLPDIEIPDHLPLHAYCFQHLAAHRDRPCLIDSFTGATLTYADVDLLSRRAAAGLHGLGLRRGEVLMLLLPNCQAFALAFLAASRLGAIVTTANPFHTAPEVAKQAAASAARIVLTESCHVPKVVDLNIPIICVDGPLPDGCIPFSDVLSADEAAVPEVEIDPDAVVALPYSSGTTGLPKGVMLTHRGLVTSLAQQVDGDNPNLYFHEEDVILCVLPLFHIYSLNSVLLCGLRAGAALLIMRRFDVAVLMELVERYKVTIAPFVPPIVVEMVKSPAVDRYDLSSIRTVMSGAAPMGKELQDKLMAKIPNAKLGQVWKGRGFFFFFFPVLWCRCRSSL